MHRLWPSSFISALQWCLASCRSELLALKCTWRQRKRGKPPSTLKIKPDRNNQKTWKSHSAAWVLLFEVIKMLVCAYLRTKSLSHHMSERGSGSMNGMVHLGGKAPSLSQWVLWAGRERGGAGRQCTLGSKGRVFHQFQGPNVQEVREESTVPRPGRITLIRGSNCVELSL